MKDLAPIVLFVYNRPEHTRKTLNALQQNDLAADSKLIIFADGAKNPSNCKEINLISEVKSVLISKKWCGEVELIERTSNFGLADSIVDGVTQVISHYGKAIVLEDDIVVEKGFLKFMNEALVLYQLNRKVYHITGHSFPIGLDISNKTYFLRYVSPWGWATWKDRWEQLILDPNIIFEKLKEDLSFDLFEFNSGYGNEFYDQLLSNINGTLKTWAIKWHSTIYLNQALALFPVKSLVRNIGFDGSGTNCSVVDVSASEIAEYADIDLNSDVSIDKDALVLFHKFYTAQSKGNTSISILQRIKRTVNGRLQSIFMD